ncbi:MAG: carbon monoxide dehydrogenase accessory protein CooC [Acetobacteraceae bacterium]
MKIATVGKGGSGKTTIAGLLARILAGRDQQILAIDGDPNPNLALTLGMSRAEADRITYIPADLMHRVGEQDGVSILKPSIPEHEIMERFGHRAAENVDLIVMGKPAQGTAGTGCMCASHRAVRGLIAELTDIGQHTITDMEAGLEHLKRGTARNVDLMLIVAEPYYRSLEAAMRTHALAEELAIPFIRVVANKVRNDQDREAIAGFCAQHGMTIIGAVPQDEALMEAERQARSPYDFAPGCAAVAAMRTIADAIESLAAARSPGPGGPGAAALA